MILIDHDYHVVEFNARVPEYIWSWLETKFGLGDGTRWFIRHNRLYFTNSKDHLMFILAWGDK